MAMRMKKYNSEMENASSHLWVGNLPLDVTESDLAQLFGKYGLLDEITCYASRTYAFVYFKRVEDAVAAKDALQGFLLYGTSIKIEFAKPVCSLLLISLLIGVIMSSYSNFSVTCNQRLYSFSNCGDFFSLAV